MPQNPDLSAPDTPGSCLLIVRVCHRLSGFPEGIQSPDLESVQTIKTITESMDKPHTDPSPGYGIGPDISVRSASSIVERIRRAVISSAVPAAGVLSDSGEAAADERRRMR